jgi:hypothetical protein
VSSARFVASVSAAPALTRCESGIAAAKHNLLERLFGAAPEIPKVVCLIHFHLIQWKNLAAEETGVSASRFFELLKELEEEKKVAKSPVDGKWHQVSRNSGNYFDEKDQ